MERINFDNTQGQKMYKEFVQHRSCVKHRHIKPSPFYSSMLHSILRLPTVHASNGEAEDSSNYEDTEKPQPLPALQKPKLIITDQEIQDYLSKETGMDRVKDIFQKDSLDQYHPDLHLIFGIVKGAGVGCFMVSSLIGAMNAKEEFIKTHRHVKFATKFRATRAYQDAIFIGAIKTGAYIGFKVALFSSIFVTSSTCVAVYRNKSSPIEYMVGGAISGSLLKLSLGLKGMFAGGVIGSVLGLGSGLLLTGALNMTGETQDVRHSMLIRQRLLQKKESALLAAGELSKEEAATMQLVHNQ